MSTSAKAILAVFGYLAGVLVFAYLACWVRRWYGRKYLGETDEAGW